MREPPRHCRADERQPEPRRRLARVRHRAEHRLRRRLLAQVRVVDDPRRREMRRPLDLGQQRRCLGRRRSEVAVVVHDVEQVVVDRADLVRIAPQRGSSRVVTSGVEHDRARALERRGDRGRQRGRVERGARERGRDHAHAARLEQRRVVRRAEVRVHDVEVDQGHGLRVARTWRPRVARARPRGQVEREVHGQVRLPAPVVAGHDREAPEVGHSAHACVRLPSSRFLYCARQHRACGTIPRGSDP